MINSLIYYVVIKFPIQRKHEMVIFFDKQNMQYLSCDFQGENIRQYFESTRMYKNKKTIAEAIYLYTIGYTGKTGHIKTTRLPCPNIFAVVRTFSRLEASVENNVAETVTRFQV